METGLSIRELVAIRNQQLEKQKQRPADVWSLEPILADPYSLAGKVVFDGNQMCPPAEAALAHLMYLKVLRQSGAQQAFEAAQHLVSKISHFERSKFVPPIKLSDEALS